MYIFIYMFLNFPCTLVYIHTKHSCHLEFVEVMFIGRTLCELLVVMHIRKVQLNSTVVCRQLERDFHLRQAIH